MHYSWTPSIRRNVAGILLICIVICTATTTAYAKGNTTPQAGEATTPYIADQPSLTGTTSIRPVRTDSPRETFRTFQRLTREFEAALLAYWENQNRANAARLNLFFLEYGQLSDLSSVPKASLRKARADSLASLLDIIGRIDPPPIESIPSAKAFFDDQTLKKWRIPGTPITIDLIEEGPREGEFLFGARTLTVANTFYRQIQHLPLRSSLGITSWRHTLFQLHGPMIPKGFVSALPDRLKHTWLDAAVWKILMVIIVSALAIFLLYMWRRIINLRVPKGRIAVRFQHLLTPTAIILVVLTLESFFSSEVIVVGTFARMVFFATTLVIYFAAVWVFWLLILTLFEWIILSPKIPDESLDANLLRLGARIIGFVGAVLILAYGAQDLGLSLYLA